MILSFDKIFSENEEENQVAAVTYQSFSGAKARGVIK